MIERFGSLLLGCALIGGFVGLGLQLDSISSELQGSQRAILAPGHLSTPRNLVNKIDSYTEITLTIRNPGNDLARNVREDIKPTLIAVQNFRDKGEISNITKPCGGPDPAGRPIYPGGASIVVGFSADEMSKVNARTHYAAVVGCFSYLTVGQAHYSKFCLILEPIIDSGDWRTTNCPWGNEAN